MEVELLYVPDCPNRDLARNRLKLALRRIGRDAVIREREVHTAEQGDRLGMRGSPTILIEGEDAFAGPAATGLACRIYRNASTAAGAPTVDELVEALASRLKAEGR
jgi:hypothetical protein